MTDRPRYVGSAGWNIPRVHRDRFAADGSQLQRYASRLNAAEINTSFYRPHARPIYERWASAVPGAAVPTPSGWAGVVLVTVGGLVLVIAWRWRWVRRTAAGLAMCMLAWTLADALQT